MALTTAQIQQAYVTFFNRPADNAGLTYWSSYKGSDADLYNTFAKSAEYLNLFAGSNSTATVNTIYTNLLGRAPEPAGLAYWVQQLDNGALAIGNIALAIGNGAQGSDKTTVTNKVSAATQFTTALDTTAEITGYASPSASSLASVKTWLGGVTTDATLATQTSATNMTAITTTVATGAAASGSTFTLTTGVDAVVGTDGADTINGTLLTLNAFDSVNGGNGVDTLNLSSTQASAFTLPASVTYSNLEIVNASHAGTAGTNAIAITDTTFGTGVQKLTYTEAGAGTTSTAAVTLNSATDVSVISKATAFTTVAITDKSTTVADTGSTLKNVTIEKATGAATLTGNAIETVSLNAVGGLTTVTAAAGTRALTVNASGTTAQGGLTDATATSATLNVSGNQNFGTLTVAKATSVSINATGELTATLAAAAATALTLDGTKLNTLTVTGTDPIATITVKGSGGVTSDVSGITALTTVDTTASTAAAPATGTATGANTLTIGTGVTYNGGAGQDKVTVGATTKAVALGAGNDTATVSVTALGAGGSVAGGDGTDVLKLANADAVTLSTAGTAQAAFKAAVTGFETLDITTQTGSTVDVSKIGTFSQVNMVSASAAQVLSGITTGMTIQSTYGAAGTSITTNTLTSISDTMTFVMKGDLSGGARVFGTLANPGVETLTINMADTNTTFTSTLATLTVTDANLKSLVLTGNNGLALTHAGTELYNLDASGLTKGAVTFTSGALATDTTAKGSVLGGDTLDFASALAKVTITATAGTNTLKGSSGAYANTITGGTGNDTIVGGSAVDTISAGAGTTANTITGAGGMDVITLTGSTGADTLRYDTIATSAAAAGAQMDTITGFKAGSDKINFAQGAASLTGVTTDGTGDAVATMAAVVDNATSVATVADVYTALAAYTTLTASAAAGTATVAQVYNFTTGAAAGTYLVVNDATVGFQGATDVVIKLVGTEGTISAADFAFAA